MAGVGLSKCSNAFGFGLVFYFKWYARCAARVCSPPSGSGPRRPCVLRGSNWVVTSIECAVRVVPSRRRAATRGNWATVGYPVARHVESQSTSPARPPSAVRVPRSEMRETEKSAGHPVPRCHWHCGVAVRAFRYIYVIGSVFLASKQYPDTVSTTPYSTTPYSP